MLKTLTLEHYFLVLKQLKSQKRHEEKTEKVTAMKCRHMSLDHSNKFLVFDKNRSGG